ncbi:hypothetical protein [Bergeyella zoohelcum]|nr:hypothetical protein [Bergeyella zoohelcum]
MRKINIYNALRAMRKLSKENIPFSIEFISCNRSEKSSEGWKRVDKAILVQGYRKDQSGYAMNLIAYENAETGQRRHFWLPLLMKFNGIKITYDRVHR